MATPFSPALAAGIISRALECEIGLAVSFDDDTDVTSIRNRLYEARSQFPGAEDFQISVMDLDPKEIWIVRKSLDIMDLESKNGK